MSVTADILRSYRDPAGVARQLLATGQREDRALAFLMVACLLMVVARIPVIRREQLLGGASADAVPTEGMLAPYLFAILFGVPLVAYGIAAASHLLARAAGGRGTFHGARLALFWALLAVSPLTLLHGLAAGLAGPGPLATWLGVAVFGAFLWIWLGGLRAAEFGTAPA